MMTAKLKAPFPWFGGKSRVDDLVWARFGQVRNYVEPFAGSLAVLLGRPNPSGTETVNDIDCYVANFWRAVSADPVAVAAHADNPVNEADLHARHLWLVNQAEFRERMKTDPEFFDVRVAGWWVWGISCWIGGGWCALRERPWQQRPHLGPHATGQGVHKKIPALHPKGGQGVAFKRPMLHPAKAGPGVRQALFDVERCMPEVSVRAARGSVRHQIPDLCMGAKGSNVSDDLASWFAALCDRLRSVRVVCGDWLRVLGDTPLGLTSNMSPQFKTAVFLDPPYDGELRDAGIYAQDSNTISAAVRAWAIEHGGDPRLRIALCGYEGEHQMPDTWECVAWKAAGGYGNRTGNDNANLERIWFSPYCLRPGQGQGELAL
ncbi:MAG TPA: DNA adenine methylase [Opitutaceae bacterium]|nr:DNA adenine methylase [Opitutaceae bacterium]